MNKEFTLKICESNQNVFRWECSKGIYFRGYFSIDDVFYRGSIAVDKIYDLIKNYGLIDSLKKINGFYSIIYEDAKYAYLGNDRLRSFPLFYLKKKNELIISDNINVFGSINQKQYLDFEAISEFEATSLFVSGSKTMIRGISQVEAGQVVVFNKKDDEVYSKLHYRYNHDNISDLSIQKLKKEFEDVYFNMVGKTLINSLKGRTVVVPLSGGADSRMVISILNKYQYRSVVCFTYGDIESYEAKISKKVADAYCYKWHFVKYSKESWEELKNRGIYQQYLEFAGNYSSCPHIQDLFAVYYLKKEKIIPEDSIFVPGHSGDMLAGSHITEDFIVNNRLSQENLVSLLIEKHYPFVHLTKIPSEKVNDHVLFNLKKQQMYTPEEAANEYEFFNMIERQAKFICNSVRVYEFFGFEWRMPLWDNNLIEFWSHIPIELRYHRKFYFESLGEDPIKSTNEQTIYKLLATIVRKKFKFLRKVSRYYYRLKEYENHHFKWGQIVSKRQYKKYVLEAGEKFQINYIIMKEYLNRVLYNKC